MASRDKKIFPWRLSGWLAGIIPIIVIIVVLSVPTAGQRQWARNKQPDPDTVDCKKERCIALTFDDGPGPYTSTLLRLLRSYRAKATFFELGERISAHPEWSKQVAEAGMLMGIHSWNHPYMTWESLANARRQLTSSISALEKATGQRTHLFRPPAGLSTPEIRLIEAELGLSEILWNMVPYDWEHSDQPEITVKAIVSYAQPGAVFLLHDIHEGTVEAVAEVLPWLAKQGYVLVTIDHLIRSQTGVPPEPGKQYWDRSENQLSPIR